MERRSKAGEELNAAELAAWQGFLRIAVRLRRELGAALEAEHELTMADYDLLVRLVDQPGRRMSMAALAETVLQPRSSLTRIADGLEARGLVVREPHPTDGRGLQAVLTAAGLAAFRGAQRSHLERVRASFLDRLTDEQLRDLAAVWDAVGERPG